MPNILRLYNSQLKFESFKFVQSALDAMNENEKSGNFFLAHPVVPEIR